MDAAPFSAATPPAAPSIDQIKQAMRAAWTAGDFGMVARPIFGDAEAFISRLPLPPNAAVLDLACGTGNLAIPLAHRGAHVTGCDIAPNLLAQARERAAAEGLAIQFDEGDAEALPYPNASFDLVASMFGAMFAPRPHLVVAELARVLRPGGLLAMANWNPESFSATLFLVTARHVPPPPGIEPPVLWGSDAVVRARLATSFNDIRTELVPLDFRMPTNAPGAVAFFRQYFGPTHVAFGRLSPDRQAELQADLENLWAGANVDPHPEERMLVRNQYLQVLATRA